MACKLLHCLDLQLHFLLLRARRKNFPGKENSLLSLNIVTPLPHGCFLLLCLAQAAPLPQGSPLSHQTHLVPLFWGSFRCQAPLPRNFNTYSRIIHLPSPLLPFGSGISLLCFLEVLVFTFPFHDVRLLC